MAWIELHDSVWEHHRIIKLADSLDLDLVDVVGHMVSLWHFTLRNAVDSGDLSAWGDSGIERGSRWSGEKGKFVKAVRDCGLLEGSKIHDWHDFTLHYHLCLERQDRQREQIRERVRNYRERKRNASVTKCNADTQPNPTQPTQPTQPNHTKPTDIGRIIPPKLEWVKAFCLERKNQVDPEKFMAYYESNGWRVGKNPMKSWKAAICGTWERNNGNGHQGNGQERIVGHAAPVPGKYDHLTNRS